MQSDEANIYFVRRLMASRKVPASMCRRAPSICALAMCDVRCDQKPLG